MTNKEIATEFNLLAQLMELHNENPFKIRSYASAYINIRKLPFEASEASQEKLLEVNGIGKAVAEKIEELNLSGRIRYLESYKEKTPGGVIEMLGIKGLGAKKILQLWKELGIESPGELLYACAENRLIELKGFGAKTQESIANQIRYFLDSKGKYLFGHIYQEGEALIQVFRAAFSEARFEFTKEYQRKMPVLDSISIISTANKEKCMTFCTGHEDFEETTGEFTYKNVKFDIQFTSEEELNAIRFANSCSTEFIESFKKTFPSLSYHHEEEELFRQAGLHFIPAESRELPEILKSSSLSNLWELIAEKDIKGVVHTHSTWSDGLNSIAEMAQHSQNKAYEYLVMSDHSKSAFYANGLSEDRIAMQMEEIDRLNKSYTDFKIFKSIECDILYSGDLDYDDSVLASFDLVIASIHSILKMDEEKATSRLIKAIENKYTRILGHPTGRLLLSREAYPIDHKKVIDACACHGVVIELNANPYRLDIDWTWIDYAVSREVLISINPDAHNIKGIEDIKFGVFAARKAGLQTTQCLNAKNLKEFEDWVHSK